MLHKCFCRAIIMCKIVILCTIPAVLSIIVRDPPPSATDYKYSYDIEDPYTGDSKSQHEVRQGDFVSGAYSVVGPDGTKRTVEYTADSKNGFQAVIREEPAEETTPQPKQQKVPYVSKSRFYTKPVYTLEGAKLQYGKDSENIAYFTPSNEIGNKKITFEVGKFFEPAH